MTISCHLINGLVRGCHERYASALSLGDLEEMTVREGIPEDSKLTSWFLCQVCRNKPFHVMQYYGFPIRIIFDLMKGWYLECDTMMN